MVMVLVLMMTMMMMMITIVIMIHHEFLAAGCTSAFGAHCSWVQASAAAVVDEKSNITRQILVVREGRSHSPEIVLRFCVGPSWIVISHPEHSQTPNRHLGVLFGELIVRQQLDQKRHPLLTLRLAHRTQYHRESFKARADVFQIGVDVGLHYIFHQV